MKNLLCTFTVLLVSVFAYGAESAASILQAISQKFDGNGAVEAQFTLSVANQRVEGSVIMERGKFQLTTPGFSVWYDGNTQWTMIASSQEVNITEPTLEELMESNPFVIVSNWRQHYKALRLSDSDGRRRVQLTPLHPEDTQIANAVIYVNADNWPAIVDVTFNDSSKVTVIVEHIATVAAKRNSYFVFDPAANPAIEVIDLR